MLILQLIVVFSISSSPLLIDYAVETLTTPDEAREYVLGLRGQGNTVGLVPTMGALHDGHVSLAAASVAACQATVATIFVNPTQFGPGEDLDKYPRTIDQDKRLLDAAGVDAVYLPTKEAMYPNGYSTSVSPPSVSQPLEGICRPDHFAGVATVVLKLFGIVPATHAFFGRKDYQQLKVIEAMVRDLNVGIKIVSCDTLRESDGLALSSRNRYLDSSQRERALLLSRALQAAEDSVTRGCRDIGELQQTMRHCLLGDERGSAGHSACVDSLEYAVVVDSQTLMPMQTLDRPAVALIAAFIGTTRLIDNRTLSP